MSRSYTFHWNNNTFVGNPYTYTLSNNPVSFDVFALDADGCPSDTLTIQINPMPEVELMANPTEGCAPLCPEFSTSLPISDPLIDTFMFYRYDSSICLETPKEHEIKMLVITPQGCIDTIKTTLDVHPSATADFIFSPDSIAETIDQIEVFNLSTHNEFNEWRIDSVFYSNNEEPIFSDLDTGTFSIQLFANNSFLCNDSIEKILTILPSSNMFIPNAFTPNRDQINQTYGPVFEHLPKSDLYSFTIFDRWGGEVFHTNDPKIQWDGKTNNIAQPQGKYLYRISYAKQNKEKVRLKGHVILVR